MKNIILTFLIFASLQACSSNDAIFELSPNQSMLMTGKGRGQDGAINPYIDGNSIARVKNLGQTSFSVRIQDKRTILKTETINKGESREFILLKGHTLFFDTEEKAKAKITFRPYKE